jgi:type II secretory pathway pseudopilin PulG
MSKRLARARTGFTLAELVMAMTIMLVIGGTAIALLVRQQRLYASLNAVMTARATVRDAADILTADLRTVAPQSDTLAFASDTAIQLRSTIGASTVEAVLSSTQVTLPPDTLSDGTPQTFLLTTPDADDDALIYHDSTAAQPARGWDRIPIASISGSGPYRLTFAAPLPASVAPGAPLRVLRAGRYSVYRASDRAWYLGYRRCPRTGGCTTVQPLSGPYDDTATPPITFRYYAADGSIATGPGPLTNVARLEVIAHARAFVTVRVPGMRQGSVIDSTLTTISFRNQ